MLQKCSLLNKFNGLQKDRLGMFESSID